MALVKESRCETECRKDCSLKRICQFRHSNEEAGKDLEYYTRKFDRVITDGTQDASTSPPDGNNPDGTGDTCGDTTLSLPVVTTFPVSNFAKVSVKGDGHCIIHSVLSLLQEKGSSVPSWDELLGQIKLAFQADLEHFAPFIDGCNTDPIEEMDAYVNDAKYTSSIVDLIVPLLARVLQVGIVVVQLDSSKDKYVTNDNLMYPSPTLIVGEPLYLLKSGSHYDPLHSISSNTPTASERIVPEVPSSPSGGSQFLNTIPEEAELDPVRILASLCANAPDLEIRDCLRKYSCDFSLKRQTSVFNSFTKPVLAKSAEYLNLRIENLKKPDIIHALIVKFKTFCQTPVKFVKKAM